MSYYISTFNNGQPFILYLENEKANLYTIQGGKIYSKGIAFSDVAANFRLHETINANTCYVSYLSTDNIVKIYSLKGNTFIPAINLPLSDNNSYEINHYKVIMLKNDLYIIYIKPNQDNSASLFCTSTTAPSTHTKLLNNISELISFEIVSCIDYCIILIDCHKIYVWKLNSNLTIKLLEAHDNSLELSNKSLNKRIFQQQQEITRLNAIHEHTTAQYNDLTQYAKQLQNELRKTKMCLL